MSERVLSRDFLKAVTDALMIPPLKSTVAEALTGDVEYRLREIIQEGLKFMKHAKRSMLTTADIDAALKVRNIEVPLSLYSFIFLGETLSDESSHSMGSAGRHNLPGKAADSVASNTKQRETICTV